MAFESKRSLDDPVEALSRIKDVKRTGSLPQSLNVAD